MDEKCMHKIKGKHIVHRGRCKNISDEGSQLAAAGNHHADSINQRIQQLQTKLDHLAALASRRKAKLVDNSAYLQFMWKADVVESWIADKVSLARVFTRVNQRHLFIVQDAHVNSDEYGRDLSSVQTLLTKQETFDAGKKWYFIQVSGFFNQLC